MFSSGLFCSGVLGFSVCFLRARFSSVYATVVRYHVRRELLHARASVLPQGHRFGPREVAGICRITSVGPVLEAFLHISAGFWEMAPKTLRISRKTGLPVSHKRWQYPCTGELWLALCGGRCHGHTALPCSDGLGVPCSPKGTSPGDRRAAGLAGEGNPAPARSQGQRGQASSCPKIDKVIFTLRDAAWEAVTGFSPDWCLPPPPPNMPHCPREGPKHRPPPSTRCPGPLTCSASQTCSTLSVSLMNSTQSWKQKAEGGRAQRGPSTPLRDAQHPLRPQDVGQRDKGTWDKGYGAEVPPALQGFVRQGWAGG